ncbi:Conserved_hypothetical protein [Hexamita inflata]|uniref:Uncharacterized protein n=2 Tax=Hexamita inflata TaxID=28002 RepID=A0AA86Q2Y9_9EUKA|nr:Conserved hypothetical protein [Hexamita inflata]
MEDISFSNMVQDDYIIDMKLFAKIFQCVNKTHMEQFLRYFTDINRIMKKYNLNLSASISISNQTMMFANRIVPFLIDQLYNVKMQNESIQAVKNIFKVKNDVQLMKTHTQLSFYRNCAIVLQNSANLYNITILPQLCKLYFGNQLVIQPDELSNGTFKEVFNQDGTSSEHQYSISMDNNTILARSCEKKAGASFGSIVILSTSWNTETIQLFAKAYFGYPSRNTLFNNCNIIQYTQSPTYHFGPQKHVNLNEPLIYKILERLSFGPISKFIINNNIDNGFYIVTEDLSCKTQNFLSMNDFTKQLFTYQQKKAFPKVFENVNAEDLKSPLSVVVDLNIISIFIAITQIYDIKHDNFGFVLEKNQQNSIYECEIIQKLQSNQIKWKIIDFIPYKKNYPRSIELSNVKERYQLGRIFSGKYLCSIPEMILLKEENKQHYLCQALTKFNQILINMQVDTNETITLTKQEEYDGDSEAQKKAKINFKSILHEEALKIKALLLTDQDGSLKAQVLGFEICDLQYLKDRLDEITKVFCLILNENRLNLISPELLRLVQDKTASTKKKLVFIELMVMKGYYTTSPEEETVIAEIRAKLLELDVIKDNCIPTNLTSLEAQYFCDKDTQKHTVLDSADAIILMMEGYKQKSLNNYIVEAFEDLDTYCQLILMTYNTIQADLEQM